MAATIIDGKAVAAEVRGRVAEDVKAYADAHDGRVPGLATVLVGDDPASHVYVSNKRKHTEEVGMRSIHRGLDASTSQEELLALVGELNVDDGRRRDPRPAPAPRRHRPGRRDRGDRPGQGRRRADCGKRRAAWPRAAPASSRARHRA